MNIYVGNLPYGVNDNELKALFVQHGSVENVKIIMDSITGKSKGFAFVDMKDDQEAQAAIDALNGQEFQGRTIVVNKAKPRAPREGGHRDNRGGYNRDRRKSF